MSKFIITVFDIKDIQKPLFLDEIVISAEFKSEAADVGHTIFEEKYPAFKRLIETKELPNFC